MFIFIAFWLNSIKLCFSKHIREHDDIAWERKSKHFSFFNSLGGIHSHGLPNTVRTINKRKNFVVVMLFFKLPERTLRIDKEQSLI